MVPGSEACSVLVSQGVQCTSLPVSTKVTFVVHNHRFFCIIRSGFKFYLRVVVLIVRVCVEFFIFGEKRGPFTVKLGF